MKKITVQWLGHSCFKLTFGDYTVVIDPYEDGSVPGLLPIQASAIDVLCSHSHHDHGAKNVVKQLRMYAPRPQIIQVKTFHDNECGVKRGENIVHVFDHEGLRIAHFGDLGHLLTAEQIQEIGTLDAALIPVGGFYTINAKTAKEVAKQTGARVVIPMHYKTKDFGFDVIAPLKEFTDLCDDVVYYDTDTIEITQATPKQTAVLEYIHPTCFTV